MSGQNQPSDPAPPGPQSPGPESPWLGSTAPPPASRGSARELVALLLLVAAAAGMLGAPISQLGYGSFRLMMASSDSIFLGYPDVLIALAVVVGIGRRPGPNAKAIGIAAVVLLAVSVVFGVLLGLPGVFVRHGNASAFGGLIEYLGELAIALAAILAVREVLSGVPGIPVVGSTTASGPVAPHTGGPVPGTSPHQPGPAQPGPSPQQPGPSQGAAGQPGGSHPFARPGETGEQPGGGGEA